MVLNICLNVHFGPLCFKMFKLVLNVCKMFHFGSKLLNMACFKFKRNDFRVTYCSRKVLSLSSWDRQQTMSNWPGKWITRFTIKQAKLIIFLSFQVRVRRIQRYELFLISPLNLKWEMREIWPYLIVWDQNEIFYQHLGPI